MSQMNAMVFSHARWASRSRIQLCPRHSEGFALDSRQIMSQIYHEQRVAGLRIPPPPAHKKNSQRTLMITTNK
jgi:hypothetical protein